MEGSKRKWDQPDSEPAKAAAAPAIEVSAAAAAAARVAAQLAKAAANPDSGASMSSSLAGQGGTGAGGGPATFTHKVDINDLRNRYLLAKPATAEEIRAETGCNVAVAGVWLMDRSRAKEHELPMHLVLTASTKASLDAGIARVDELIRTELGPLIEDRAKQKADWEARRPVRTKWPEEKVTVNLESIRNFNVRAKVVGPGGLFVKYIQQETGCKVQLKGRGSGFIDQETGAEADEPMFVSVAGPDEEQVRIARDLAADLLVVVREEHEKVRTGATMSTQQQYLNATGAYYAQQLQGELVRVSFFHYCFLALYLIHGHIGSQCSVWTAAASAASVCAATQPAKGVRSSCSERSLCGLLEGIRL